MQKKIFQFSSARVSFYFDADISLLKKLAPQPTGIILTDENVYRHHSKKFSGWHTIVIPAGENHKNQETVDQIIRDLIEYGADRGSKLIGVGGGVVTDITGYVASVYMRGISFGFVPTSILAMVDASIGGKNGIDVGIYKNMVGTMRQPDFLIYDTRFLRTLPDTEWVNGFAEIIKHACIRDAKLFRELENSRLADFRKNKSALNDLITRNVKIKSGIVQTDEFEKNERRLLNFGHTLGHAVENLYHIPHGHAVSIGMVAAAVLSETFGGFKEAARVRSLLERYGLRTQLDFDVRRVAEIMRMDKKRVNHSLHYILLEKIGKAVIKTIPFDDLTKTFYSLERSK